MKRKMQYLAVFSSTISILSYGMCFGWPSPSLPKLQSSDSTIKITNYEGSWLAVMPFVGALFGAPFAAILANIYGRKLIILSASIPLTASWLTIAFAENYISLIIARALGGFGGNILFTVVPSYIAEVTDPKIRGKLAAMLTWMWNLGIFIIYVCGPFLTIKTMAFISISVPILFVLFYIWMPESPYFYINKRRREDAKNVLKIFRGDEDVDKIIEAIEEDLSVTTSVWDIFKYPINRKTLFLILTLITVQEFSGRSPFLFYSQKIFQEADKNVPAAYISMIYGFIQLLSSFSGSLIVDKFGRKPLLFFSCFGSSLCLIVEGTFFFLKDYLHYNLETIKYLPVITLILFVVIFTVGLGIVPMIMAGEMFSINVKSNGLCIVDLYAATISIAISKFFQFSSDEIGAYVPFWTFAVICVFGIVFIVKLLPETKGLSLEEIQKNLKT